VHTWCQVGAGLPNTMERRTLSLVTGVHPVPAAIHLLIEEGLSVPLIVGPRLHDAMASLSKTCILRFAAHVLESGQKRPPSHPALQFALELLASNPVEIRTASELARRCGISLSRLRQLFHETGGESPSSMLWRLKGNHAIQMIRSTGLALAQIAEQCGFANPFHLSRWVKNWTGHSPRELRRIEWH